MKKVLKWIGIGLGVVLLLLAITTFYFKSKFENLADRKLDPKVTLFDIPSDSVSIERGKLLAVGCRNCHGNDYAGSDFFNDPGIGYLSSPNLTPAPGSATEKYSVEDWVRTLRHAVNPLGKPVFVMPSESIGLASDQDLGSIIAYLKTLTPVTKPLGPTSFTFFAKVMAGAGMFGNLYPYDIIKHDEVHRIQSPPKSTQPDYGAYLARYHACKYCHGESMNGGIPGDPLSPPASNITTGGNLGNWSLDQFRETMRSGKTPEGKMMDAKFMPWPGIGAHDDEELEAVFNYIKSLPGLPNSAV
ncbi:MAG: c-type cytochrome [Saprospiraceae bacterium]|nr:c-type cytochrome [Saprospiraceae bacterium]